MYIIQHTSSIIHHTCTSYIIHHATSYIHHRSYMHIHTYTYMDTNHTHTCTSIDIQHAQHTINIWQSRISISIFLVSMKLDIFDLKFETRISDSQFLKLIIKTTLGVRRELATQKVSLWHSFHAAVSFCIPNTKVKSTTSRHLITETLSSYARLHLRKEEAQVWYR